MMHRGSVESMWLVEVEVRACVWAGQRRSRCCAVSSSPPQCVVTMETVVIRFGVGSWPEAKSDPFSAERR